MATRQQILANLGCGTHLFVWIAQGIQSAVARPSIRLDDAARDYRLLNGFFQAWSSGVRQLFNRIRPNNKMARENR